METLTIEIGIDKLKAGLEKSVDEFFKRTYDNPVQKLLEDAIKDKNGQLKLMFDEIIANALNRPEFKDKLADAVMTKLVESALKR